MRVLAGKVHRKYSVPVVPEDRCATCKARGTTRNQDGLYRCPRHTIQARLSVARKELHLFEQGAATAARLVAKLEAELAAITFT